jgi:AcrR family transcriptional regulator
MAEKLKGALTKEEIVRAAYALIIEQGYHGTSMRQIAEHADIALGGIYNHFASKEEIFKAVVFAYHPYHEMIPALEAAEGDTIEELFRNAIWNLLPILRERKDIFNLMFIELVEFKGKHVPEVFELVFPPLLNFVQKLTSAKGSLRDISAPNLVRTFASLMLGFMLTEQLLAFQMPEDVNAQALDNIVDIYLYGIMEN